jgi:hypothetical protein
VTSDPSPAGPGALQPAGGASGSGNANGNANATGSASGGSPGNAAEQASGGSGAPSANAQSAQAGATADQSSPGNGNVSVAVGNGNGNEQAVGQANNAHASATAGATGNDPPPGSDPTATSSASAAQTSPTNTNVNVMVGSPGDTGPVAQSNDATAAAAAQGTGGGGQADASASQTSPANVNVVVRVASPGENGSVTQTNSANASAGATLPAQGSPGSQASTGPFGTNQVVTTSGSAAVDNESEIDQSIEQTPDENLTAPGSTAGAHGSPAATTTVGTAAATQSDARNVNVSVRVGSPGNDEHVSQANGATATGSSPTLGVVTVKGNSNTNVSIVLPGPAQGAPAGDWTWNWVWNSSWTPLPGMTSTDAAPTSTDIWNWLWSNQPAAAPATGAATTATSGIWSWSWSWTMAGGQNWTLSWQQACDCSWTWNWVWDWSTGAPASTPTPAGAAASTSDAAPDDPSLFAPVDQQNDATATASASVSAFTSTTLAESQTGVDPSLGLQNVRGGQTIVNLQGVAAVAQVAQTRASNLNIVYGAPIVSIKQKNGVSADAAVEAMAHLSAAIEQQQNGAPSSEQWAEADQWVGSEQVAEVGALATQSGARNVNIVWAPRPNQALVGAVDQENAVTATASAELAAHLEAWIGQYQTAGSSSLQEADATQVLANEQTALVAAVAAQSDVANVNDLLVPAGSRATNPSLRQRNVVTTTSTGGDYSVIDASIFQVQDGDADIELASAVQQASATQSATVYSPAQQSNLLNKDRWLGVEPPADAAAEPEPDQEPLATSQTTGASAPLPPTIRAFHSTTFLEQAGSRVQAHSRTTIDLGPAGPRSATAVGTPRLEHSPGSGSSASPLVPPSLGLPASQPEPGAARAAGALPIAPRDETALDRPSPGSAGAAPTGPDNPCCGSSTDLGAAGIAPPSGGSSAPALALPTYKLAAPAPTGPQMPAPILGRSVTFPEPFERPG